MKITIIKGDITKIKADAIVNAANSYLVKGGGVDNSIHIASGSELQDELNEIKKKLPNNKLATGEVVKTKPYNLKENNVKLIIHTVGPRAYSDPQGLLLECYEKSLEIAEKNNCKSIAFPAISTGAYGLSIERSAKVVRYILKNFEPSIIEEVILVLFKDEDKKVYEDIIIKKKDYEDALVNMDDMRFCRYCLATMGDVIPKHGDFWTCSEECSNNLLKRNSNQINDLISHGLKK